MFKKIDKILDTTKPTLIVGWKKVKELYPEQKITNKKIGDNLFWTFTEREKKNENLQDIKNFTDICLDHINSKYVYYFLNPFSLSYSKIKKLIEKIDSVDKKIYCFDGKHFFILVDNVILGVNMDFLELTNVTENKVKSWLYEKHFEIFDISNIFNIREIENKNRGYLLPALKEEFIYEKEFIIGYIFE